MNCPFTLLLAAVLFFLLTPGVLVRLPPKSSPLIVAGTHAFVFALVWTLVHKAVWHWALRNGYVRKAFHEYMTNNEEEEKEEGYEIEEGYENEEEKDE